jgi:hypothetical protein
MARVDRAARVAKGVIGAAIGVPRKWVAFLPDHPALSGETISKMPLAGSRTAVVSSPACVAVALFRSRPSRLRCASAPYVEATQAAGTID